MKYKITLANHLKALEFSIIILLIIIGFGWYQHSQNNLDESLRNILAVFALFSFLPVLYLHFEYHCHNRVTQLEIDIYKKKFVYTDKTGVTETYNFDDLSKVVINMSPNMHRGSSFQMLPFEQYHYAKIYTKSGQEIIVTCLMARKVKDLAESIWGVPIEKKQRIFASILIG
jgi:hypothetical protein